MGMKCCLDHFGQVTSLCYKRLVVGVGVEDEDEDQLFMSFSA